MSRQSLLFMLSAATLSIASGCMSAEADIADTQLEVAEAEDDIASTRIALRAGAAAGAGEIDGFCENGAGVYLSAREDSAELTVYVVTPAETVTFDRPALRVTTQRDDGQKTELNEFESVTLRAGESWSFAVEVGEDGTLVDVVAELATQ